MRSINKTSAHEECERLTAAYLNAGGNIRRSANRPLMICTVCHYKIQMEMQYIAQFASRCQRCGGTMKPF
jgi:hypothetical protein